VGLPPLLHKMTVEQTLAELVAIDSVSARSNAEIVSYLQQRCEAHGLTTQRFPHIDENGVEKINLLAVAMPNESKAPSSLRSAGALQNSLPALLQELRNQSSPTSLMAGAHA
jgi:acetylornithine deacetylase/succinyl-diaminopimelate desuccinylase-like protein